MEVPAIELRDVSVTYNAGTPDEVKALNKVSLSIASRSLVGIVGGNGSGKSTLLKAISGSVPISCGQVFIHGRNVTNWPVHKRAKLIGFVHQDTMMGMAPSLSLLENLHLTDPNRSWWSLSPYPLVLNARQRELIRHTGLPLTEKVGTAVSMLSGGQRQALAMLLTFHGCREIYLLDEFTSALDLDVRNNVIDFLVGEVRTHGLTTLAITHEKKELAPFVDMWVTIKQGGGVE